MPDIRYLVLILVSLTSLGLSAQNQSESAVVDSLYREDQIYIGFTYNLLTGKPENISGPQFSGGFHTGFIRDLPLNERRNIALGLGLGWSINTYGQNLFIGEEAGTERTIFRILDREEVAYNKNRFATQSVDVPLEFRWRSSTAESYKFWRVYTGLRPSYVYYFRSNFQQSDNTVRQTEVDEFNPFRLGATFTFGYNTFNFHFYYSLNSFFNEEAEVNGTGVELRTFQVGLMFYLL